MTSINAAPGVDRPTTERIWREFGAQLRAFVQRRVADPDRAEDVLSEVLLRVHQNLHRVDDQEHLTRWVYRITRNAVIDEYRRLDRERARIERVSGAVPEAAVRMSEEDDPADVLNELATCMRPLLDGLSPEQRQAVQLTELDGLTQVQAAELEGVSLSGMKSRVQRGRHRLAELLGECCALTLDARGVPMDYAAPTGCECAGK